MRHTTLWDNSNYLFNMRPVYEFGQWMMENMPAAVGYALARGGAEVAYRASPGRRGALTANLTHVLAHTRPDLPPRERECEVQRLVRRIFLNRGVYFTDLALMAGRRALSSIARFDKEGDWAPLGRVVAAGHGAILASAHLGNWHVGGVFMGVTGLPLRAVIYHNHASELMDRGVARRGKTGQIWIGPDSDGLAMLEIVRALNRGEVIALLADNPWDSRWVEMPFFGRPSRFPIGPVRIARLAEAPIFPAFCVWTQSGQYKAILRPPIWVRGDDPDVAERNALAALIGVFEEVILSHLDLWFNFTPVWDHP